MSKIKFIAIDPSMRNTAVVLGKIIDGKLVPKRYEMIITAKTKDKKIRASSDTISRCRLINDQLQAIISDYKPQVCFAETPSGSQSYSGALSYGVSCFIIGSMNPPPIELTPIEVKKGTVGTKTATKDDMMLWAVNEFPDFPYERKKDGNLVKARMEHVCDALAIAKVGLSTNQFKQLMNLYGKRT